MLGSRASTGGFTLVELMITLVLVAILLGIGVPSFVNLVRSNEMINQANSVLGGIQYARGEAAQLGLGVSICGSSDGATCDDQWGKGWLVFKDPNGDAGGTISSTNILRIGQGSASLDASSGGIVRFDNEAIRRPSTKSADTVILKRSACGKEMSRIITIVPGGRASITNGAC